MEIAPRIAGTMGMYRNLGVNFALLSIYDAMELEVDLIVNDNAIELDRALGNKFKSDLKYDHVYIDFDDCLLIDGLVNTEATKFLFQCLNKGIKLHLLTKHNGLLEDRLLIHRLYHLFDTINHIRKDESKAAYIKSKSSIFIDDSFAERKDVYTNLGIPVFAPDAIECLIE